MICCESKKMSEVISWDKAIDKKVKSSDDKDLGKVQSITRDYIQTKEGTIGKNYYLSIILDISKPKSHIS